MGDLNSGPQMNGATALSSDHSRLPCRVRRHHTYRHKPHASEPWHIDFCFVPKAWAARITGVELLDGDHWRAESDHHPLKVDLRFD
jgi:endonuclease/exonuclease/phosphatase family metal-dependent hydrolase